MASGRGAALASSAEQLHSPGEETMQHTRENGEASVQLNAAQNLPGNALLERTLSA